MFDRLLRHWTARRWSALTTFLTASMLMAVGVPAFAGQLTLSWDAVANATGYKVFYGTTSGNYASSVSVANATTYTVPNLIDGATYYFAVKATSGTTDSAYSAEVSGKVPASTAPAANFTASTVTGTAPLAVTLTDTSTGTITSRSWNLGDGTTASSQTVAKTYSNPGTYNVVLTVTGSGGSTTATKTITVTAAPPTAAFTALPTTGTAPLNVAFTDTSGGTVTSWAWTFGDGGTSTSRNPAYTYTTAGTYTVTLTVTGSGGSNKVTKTGLVTVSAPVSSGSTNPPTSPTTVSAQGLVAAFGFEESTGTQAIDASGSGNHGVISNAKRVNTANFGRALLFNGSSSIVTINDSASVDLTSGMTLEAWVYPTKTPTGWRTVILKERPSGLAYGLYANSDTGKPAESVNVSGSDKNFSAGSTLPVNKWTHLAATYDGSTQKLYANGVFVASRPQSGAITVSSGKLRIGGNLVWGEYFTGYIDEVRIYNRALTAAEVAGDAGRPVVRLVMSTASDRTNAAPLNGQAVTGNVYVSYVHLGPTATTNGVKQVKFWLDAATPTAPTTTPRIVEITAPYDLAGTAKDGTALPLNTSTLSKGVHTVSAQATLNDGTVLPVATGTFTVQ